MKDLQERTPELGISRKTFKIKKSVKNKEAAKLKKFFNFKTLQNMFETKLQQGPDLELASPTTYTNIFNPGINPDFCDSQPGVPLQTQRLRLVEKK